MTEPEASFFCRRRGAVLERWEPLPDGRFIAAVFAGGVIRTAAVRSPADLEKLIPARRPKILETHQETAP